MTAIAVNTVPTHLAGMASGTTNMLRDFGFTLGPAVIGAVALSQAALESGRSWPPVAFDALSHSYSLGFLLCGAAALLTAVLTVLAIRGDAEETLLDLELLDE